MLKKLLVVCAFSAVLLFGAVLVQAPPSLAMWLVNTHVDFFQMPYPEWAQRHSIFDRILVRAVAFKLSRDWMTRSEGKILESMPTGLVDTVLATRKQLNENFLNQRQIRHKSIDLPTYSRLVYGMAWCGGQNHLFTMLLGRFFEEVHTFALWDNVKESSPHVAVVIDINGVPVFVDAWSDVPVFVMDEHGRKLGLNIPVWSDVNKYITLQQMEGSKMARAALIRRVYDDGERRIPTERLLLPVGRVDPWEDQNAYPERSNTLFQTYLKGRIYLLFGHYRSARNHFEFLEEQNDLPKSLQAAAIWFLGKTRKILAL